MSFEGDPTPLDSRGPGSPKTLTGLEGTPQCVPCRMRRIRCGGVPVGQQSCDECIQRGLRCIVQDEKEAESNRRRVRRGRRVVNLKDQAHGSPLKKGPGAALSMSLPRDYAALSFLLLHGARTATYLASGSAADVWSVKNEGPNAEHSLPNIYVAKALRVSAGSFQKPLSEGEETEKDHATRGESTWYDFVKAYRAQISKWVILNHKNVVKIFDEYDHQSLNLHVEYCHYGSVLSYLKERPNGMLSKDDIIYATISGLDYLHTQNPPIPHGGLNAGKIFVGEGHQVKIGEFGLAQLCFQEAARFPSVIFSGFSRWMSPELLDVDPDSDDITQPTMASDIWALGCTILEITAEKLPYAIYTHDIRIQRAILGGELPDHSLHPGHQNSNIWPIIRSCWSLDPAARPSSDLLYSRLFGSDSRTP
ncbi:putative serine/threonine-protein kinase WNK6 OS=Oryza sativa subsp, japonica GN=WNK6 PE=2 SV=1 [Rhizoctonia solani AG-1 IB]|uniref:Putative serine/threonine-protein kinase WNK6 n=1 Tax=Thanatephorus cucumeris (strain AG1-IB / isolate 7/3/14) TaxID=1108050 RepID=A0A0B7G2H6_THACB|nr:putative serine/threonine-protein kinase WNK6 OS=Oryza sativa subsp, japonica GN=WNK6 PE=2 SV=1 [Rhizoctonia solani AG-1 IB]